MINYQLEDIEFYTFQIMTRRVIHKLTPSL